MSLNLVLGQMHEYTTKGLMCGTIDRDLVEQIGLKGTYGRKFTQNNGNCHLRCFRSKPTAYINHGH